MTDEAPGATTAANATTATEPSPRIAVVGVGNEIMGDDGVGPKIVSLLDDPENTRLSVADAASFGDTPPFGDDDIDADDVDVDADGDALDDAVDGARSIDDVLSSDAVTLANAGTTAFLALEAMSGADRAIVVDAIRTGASPGTIHEYRCVDGSFDGDPPDMTMHDVSFTEALVYARDVYDLPDEIRILGVEPAAIEPSLELSAAVEAAVPRVVDAISDVVTEALTDESATDRDPRTVDV